MPCPIKSRFGDSKSPSISRNTSSETLAKSPRQLRPILVPANINSPSMDVDSPLSSTEQRRTASASSDRSVISGKCVHFPMPSKLTSTHATHSREVYDRSPIIPSGDDLELPSCKSAREGCWIKCLRRRAKEAASQGIAPPHIKEINVTRAGQKREMTDDESSAPSSSAPSRATSPAPTVQPAEPIPALVFDDFGSSSSSESDWDHHHLLNPMSPGLSSPVDVSQHGDSSKRPNHARSPSDDFFRHMEIDADLKVHWKPPPADSSAYMQGVDDYDGYEEDAESDAEDHAAGDERLGMCAMGKFTRADIYRECDAFGGF